MIDVVYSDNNMHLYNIASKKNTVIAVGEKHKINKGLILVSTNNGSSWQDKSQNTPYPINNIAISNNGLVCACVTFNSSNKVIALVSRNGGLNWNTYTTNLLNIATINSIAMSGDGNLIIAVGNNGAVIRSVDSGVTWEKINTGTLFDFTSVAMVQNGSYIIAKKRDVTTNYLKSLDQGVSWVTEDISGDVPGDTFRVCGDNSPALKISTNSSYLKALHNNNGRPIISPTNTFYSNIFYSRFSSTEWHSCQSFTFRVLVNAECSFDGRYIICVDNINECFTISVIDLFKNTISEIQENVDNLYPWYIRVIADAFPTIYSSCYNDSKYFCIFTNFHSPSVSPTNKILAFPYNSLNNQSSEFETGYMRGGASGGQWMFFDYKDNTHKSPLRYFRDKERTVALVKPNDAYASPYRICINPYSDYANALFGGNNDGVVALAGEFVTSVIPAGTYMPQNFKTLISQFISKGGQRKLEKPLTVRVNNITIQKNAGDTVYYLTHTSGTSYTEAISFKFTQAYFDQCLKFQQYQEYVIQGNNELSDYLKYPITLLTDLAFQ